MENRFRKTGDGAGIRRREERMNVRGREGERERERGGREGWR